MNSTNFYTEQIKFPFGVCKSVKERRWVICRFILPLFSPSRVSSGLWLWRGDGRGCFFLTFRVTTCKAPSDSKNIERRLQAGACSIYRVQRYNIPIAVHEFFVNFFWFFFTTEGKGSKNFPQKSVKRQHCVAVLQCCSSQEAFPIRKK